MTLKTSTSCEQLEERLAALHRASLQLVQDISINSLFQRIARIACDQVGAAFTAVAVRDENGQVTNFVTSQNDEQDGAQDLDLPPGQGLIGVIAEADGPIRVDYTQKPSHGTATQNEQPITTSWLGIPIRFSGQDLGQIYLANKMDGSAFTSDDERVMETLAAYAAVAISNARSYNELHQRDRALTRRNQDLALLNNLASTLAAISELDELLKTALNQVINYFNIPIGEIYLSEEDDRTLSKALQLGKFDIPIWNKKRFTRNESLIGKTAQTGQMTTATLPYQEDPSLNNDTLLTKGIRQIACFPLTSRSEVLGVLAIAMENEETLDPMNQQLLSSIASWVGTTIENVRLNIQGRRLAVLEERERIGMDLHDGIIQSIYAVGLTLEHARLLLGQEPEQVRKRLNQSIEDLNSTIRDLRAFIMDMRPRQLFEENLIDGIQRLVNEFQANSLVEANFTRPPKGIKTLPDSHAIALFHICQEALANVAKHTQADAVEVKVWTTSDRVLLEVQDNGRGFDLEKVQFTLGHGISNMQTRAHNVGGDLDITTELGKGTKITARVPFVLDAEIDVLE